MGKREVIVAFCDDGGRLAGERGIIVAICDDGERVVGKCEVKVCSRKFLWRDSADMISFMHPVHKNRLMNFVIQRCCLEVHATSTNEGV
ncbi:hypothetical protein KCTCHS21_20990 [Cohnella abietis]|uniref:Uncharacterized protein n=1 Tax=Cohnella abietis TaxID=2507935 RepID=A0A3T1D3L0_9BACL|nr:hypothetical protein KCTCHS21_20990 [Cohnella abietis]